jgi:hypothetical protein
LRNPAGTGVAKFIFKKGQTKKIVVFIHLFIAERKIKFNNEINIVNSDAKPETRFNPKKKDS